MNTVVKPQYAKSNCIIRYEGYVIIINPPREVKIKEIDNNFLGEYLSANTPPYKYEKMQQLHKWRTNHLIQDWLN